VPSSEIAQPSTYTDKPMPSAAHAQPDTFQVHTVHSPDYTQASTSPTHAQTMPRLVSADPSRIPADVQPKHRTNHAQAMSSTVHAQHKSYGRKKYALSSPCEPIQQLQSPAHDHLSSCPDQQMPFPAHKPSPSKDQPMLSRLPHDQPIQLTPSLVHVQSTRFTAQTLHKLCLAQLMYRPVRTQPAHNPGHAVYA
jgi:hypothetical protein